MNPMYVLALMSLALVATVAADGQQQQQLEQLCKLRKEAAPVSQKSQLKSLIELLKSGSVDCSAGVKEAILDLEPVVDIENVCSKKAADIMVGFWQKYGSKKSKGRKHLPRQLKEFFLGFGLQASKLCKETLMAELQSANEKGGISQQDVKIVVGPIQQNLENIFNGDNRIENLLAIVKAENGAEEKIGLDMAPKQQKYFEMQQERCLSKFKPIYDTLIAPVVRLAAIGISYNGDELASRMSAFEQEQLYRDWFAIVIVCEAGLRYKPVSVPKEKKDAEGNTQLITILDEEDLAELKQRTGLSLDEPAVVEPVDYEAAPVSMSDPVVDEGDSYLKEAIRRHKFALSAVNKFRLRLIKRIPSLMKAYIDNKAVKFAAKRRGKFGAAGSKLVRWGFFLVASLLVAGAITSMVLAFVMTHGFAMILILSISSLVLVLLGAFVWVPSVFLLYQD